MDGSRLLRDDLLLYAVTDRSWLGEDTLERRVAEALEGGVTFLQLREKHLTGEELRREARAIQALCAARGVPFVINDDVDLALELDADGVHVGQEDMEAGQVRAKLGPDKLIGVSAHTVEEALQAQSRGADYLGVGAVFPTGTKRDAGAMTFDTLRAICDAVTIPVVAIGGISGDNVDRLRGSGIAGAAVVSAIFARPDARQAAADLRKKLEEVTAP